MTGGRRETKRRVKDKSAEERYRRERAIKKRKGSVEEEI